MVAVTASEAVCLGVVSEEATAQTRLNLDGSPSQLVSDSGFGVSEPVLVRGQDNSACATDADCGDEACGKVCGGGCASGLRVFGDFLYLRPRNAEVVYAVPFDGPVVPPPAVPIQVGRIATVDPDYEPAFRVGIERCLSECSSIGVTYTQLDTSTSDSISVDSPRVLRSMVIHPSTLDAAEDWLDASASHDINYKLIDLDYRRLWLCGPRHRVSYVAGARYGRLEQSFRSTFASLGTESIDTDVDFDGAGIRLGLEGERQAACSGFLVYGSRGG